MNGEKEYTGELWENPCTPDCPERTAECRPGCKKYKKWRAARDKKCEEEYRLRKIGDIASTQKAKSWEKTLKSKMSDRMGRREHER